MDRFETFIENRLDARIDDNSPKLSVPSHLWNSPDSHITFFSTKDSLLDTFDQAFVYAQQMTDFSPSSIIESSIEACKILYTNTPEIREHFFLALQKIFTFQRYEDNANSLLDDPETCKHLIRGSVEFLQQQFFDLNIESFQSIDKNTAFSWKLIWRLLRAGLYKIIYGILESKKNDANSYSFKQCLSQMKDYSYDPEIRNKSFNQGRILEEDLPYLQCCFAFVQCNEIPFYQLIVKTAEDHLFCLLSPLRFSIDSLQELYDVQSEIQSLKNHFSNPLEKRFVYSLLLLCSLDFTGCVEELLDCKIFPCTLR